MAQNDAEVAAVFVINMYLLHEEEETPFVGYLHMHLTTVSHSQNKDTHNYYSLSKRRPNDVKAMKPANIRPGSHERTKICVFPLGSL